MSVRTPDPNPGWLNDDELAEYRRRVPMLYVEAIPVRIGGMGEVTEVGLLLRMTEKDEMVRSLVSGRVRIGETIREALFRNLEKDLGPMAFPQIPSSPVPATVGEFFPIPGISAFYDSRQHAVSLVFVVPVTGSCDPRQDALEVSWMPAQRALSAEISRELEGGRGALLAAALATVGISR
ncbi:MAG: DUF4916 domain-containing protein [Microbacteriaceae bacterium]